MKSKSTNIITKQLKQQKGNGICGPRSKKDKDVTMETVSKSFMTQKHPYDEENDDDDDDDNVEESDSMDTSLLETKSDEQEHDQEEEEQDDEDEDEVEEEEEEKEEPIPKKVNTKTSSKNASTKRKHKPSTSGKESPKQPAPKKSKVQGGGGSSKSKNELNKQKRKLEVVEDLEQKLKHQLKLAVNRQKLEEIEAQKEQRDKEREAKRLEKEQARVEAVESSLTTQKLNFFKSHNDSSEKYIQRCAYTIQFHDKCYGCIQSCKTPGKFNWVMKDFTRVVYADHELNINGKCQVFKRVHVGEADKNGRRKYLEVPEEGEFIQPPVILPEIETMFRNYFDAKCEACWGIQRKMILLERELKNEVRKERLLMSKKIADKKQAPKKKHPIHENQERGFHENVLMETN